MPDIKIRKVDNKSIRSVDNSISASHRMRNAIADIKIANPEADFKEYEGTNEYAADKMEEGIRRGTEGIKHASTEIGRIFIRQYIKRRTDKKGRTNLSAGEFSYDHESRVSLEGNQQRANKVKLKKQSMLKYSKNNPYSRIREGGTRIRHTLDLFVRSIKTIMSGMKAMVAGMIAGGWITVIIVICCILFGAAFYFFGDNSDQSYMEVSPEVEQYTPLINKYASEFGVDGYTELIKAIMMQESGGRGKDPMQASESGFNKKYPRKPNGITDSEYSIRCGVQCIKSVLQEAKVKSPVDIDHIKLALQGYNFGNGYISWAVKKFGGYSKANAIQFSKEQAKKHGWAGYGDTEYVDHVLRYYPYGNYSYDIVDTGTGRFGLPIKGMRRGNITSHFGPRSSPGGFGSRYHQGIDIGFPTGTRVLACERGTVISAGMNGGYGNCIIVDHGHSIQTYYAHLSRINVRKGQKVVRGQYIGNVGSTGNSTGPHLHLGIQIKGKFVNPEKGYISITK